jgi:nucleotide-binding universal stress UspA family protein
MASLIVGYDGSDCARQALDEAARLGKELGDRVVIVFGYDPGNMEAPEGAADHRQVVRRHGEEVTAEALERAAEAGIQAEVDLRPERRWTRSSARPRPMRPARSSSAATGRAPSAGPFSAPPRTSSCNSPRTRFW